ncbi:MAG: DeoR family transcriptional regulator [bacterium]
MLQSDDCRIGAKNLENLKRRAFELCLAIYRVTKIFPPGEILTKQLRAAAAKIIVLLAQERIRDTILKGEEIKIYLAIAREQEWVKSINFDLLKTAYSMFIEALAQAEDKVKEGTEKKENMTPPSPKLIAEERKDNAQKAEKKPKYRLIFAEMEKRQRLILGHFSKNGEAKVPDLLGVVSGVSERTIRNDLTELMDKNLIKRIGSRRGARYMLV